MIKFILSLPIIKQIHFYFMFKYGTDTEPLTLYENNIRKEYFKLKSEGKPAIKVIAERYDISIRQAAQLIKDAK